MFLDKDWKDIIQKYLCPALDSIEKDFAFNNIEYFDLFISQTPIVEVYKPRY